MAPMFKHRVLPFLHHLTAAVFSDMCVIQLSSAPIIHTVMDKRIMGNQGHWWIKQYHESKTHYKPQSSLLQSSFSPQLAHLPQLQVLNRASVWEQDLHSRLLCRGTVVTLQAQHFLFITKVLVLHFWTFLKNHLQSLCCTKHVTCLIPLSVLCHYNRLRPKSL